MRNLRNLSITFVLLLTLPVSSVFAQTTKVLLETSLGDMTVMLYDDTPLHKDNFISLVNSKYYDGLLFHRVINEFMIQTGDPNSKSAEAGQILGSGNPGYTLPAEFRTNRFHKKGALSAARLGDQQNPQKESSGSQFYLVQGKKWTDTELAQLNAQRPKAFTEEEIKIYKELGGTPWLDFNYTVFGEVVEGLEVLDEIAKVECDKRNRPLKDVKIISARIIK